MCFSVEFKNIKALMEPFEIQEERILCVCVYPWLGNSFSLGAPGTSMLPEGSERYSRKPLLWEMND